MVIMIDFLFFHMKYLLMLFCGQENATPVVDVETNVKLGKMRNPQTSHRSIFSTSMAQMAKCTRDPFAGYRITPSNWLDEVVNRAKCDRYFCIFSFNISIFCPTASICYPFPGAANLANSSATLALFLCQKSGL